MTTIYKLSTFTTILGNGFDYTIPEDTLKIINSISQQVGSPNYIRTPTFQKKINTTNGSSDSLSDISGKLAANKKRRGQKHMEVTGEDWETIRTFQATKIEQKTGTEGLINQLRLLLNKLTDKTFMDLHSQIIGVIEKLIEERIPEEEMRTIGVAIFEIASTNKFYSRLYAELYADLLTKYKFLRPIFDDNYKSYLQIFTNIETADPKVDYDKFCEVNKINEKRKAVSTFFVNLMKNNIITQQSLFSLLHTLIITVLEFSNEENRKNEIDEITENIAILFNKKLLEKIYESKDATAQSLLINGKTMVDVVLELAKSKSKDYKSLTNKSIFKYMDLLEM